MTMIVHKHFPPYVYRLRAWLCLLTLCLASQANATISVRDDAGNTITLEKPAQRVISMAPHITELLFAAGATQQIVGTVSYSDYPEAAKAIPRIGDNQQLDLERIIAFKPDLLVVWLNGGSAQQLAQLKKLGVPIFYNAPHRLDDIPDSILRLGKLLGSQRQAESSASALQQQLAKLRQQYAMQSKVRVFYQVWDRPLYTLGGASIVSDVIRLCGGENVFAELKLMAPSVGIEEVLQANPEAILGHAEEGVDERGIALWRRFPMLSAVKNGNLFALDGDLLNRAGPRMIAGTAMLCAKLALARQHRK
ncbi:MAG: cobalamin-binding protein [Pseudomonadota bacterium]